VNFKIKICESVAKNKMKLKMKLSNNNLQTVNKMKTRFTLVALALVLMTTFSFGCAEETHAAVSDSRTIGSTFYGIILNGNANIVLTQGESTSVRIEGAYENVREVETNVSNGALVIESGMLRNVTVYVTMNDISLLQVNGNGAINARTLIFSDMLLLKVNGNGTINADVRALSVAMVINGGGKIIARGSSGDSFIKVKGNGQVYSSNLDSVSVKKDISMASPRAFNSGRSSSGIAN
jgi:hypothetical protein